MMSGITPKKTVIFNNPDQRQAYFDLIFSVEHEAPGLLARLAFSGLETSNLSIENEKSIEKSLSSIAEGIRFYLEEAYDQKAYYNQKLSLQEFKSDYLVPVVDVILNKEFHGAGIKGAKQKTAAFKKTLKNPGSSYEDCYNALPALPIMLALPAAPIDIPKPQKRS
jgi:hypothetical protein